MRNSIKLTHPLKWYFSSEALPFWTIMLIDSAIVYCSGIISWVIYNSHENGLAPINGQVMLKMLMYLACYIVSFRVFHIYDTALRSYDIKDLQRLGFTSILGAFLCFIVRSVEIYQRGSSTPMPMLVLLAMLMVSIVMMWCVRIIAGNLHNYSIKKSQQSYEERIIPRTPIETDLEAIGKMLRNTNVLITGAAGSIGSELVEQIAEFHPAKLVLVDQAETPMHDLMLKVKKKWNYLRIEHIIATITNATRMDKIFHEQKFDYVFHAAAYKHVPMMEKNPSVSIQNNVLGTRILADLSVKTGVKKFVMISTDKAVNPTNVMGCSKRLCEIYVQSLDKAIKSGEVKGSTSFVTTRFGNVLGSNGSVIPMFRKQIEQGGPVTVTHPDIIRYFMLIPEAVKLVLEAGTMGKGGEIFVFDMGEPVRIVDLAKRMINEYGHHYIDITFTGLREGEKLYEEVLGKGEDELPTHNPKIRIASVREYDYKEVCQQLDELFSVVQKYDDMLTVGKMKDIVPEFKSQNSRFEALDK